MTRKVLDTIRGGNRWICFQYLHDRGGSYHRPCLAKVEYQISLSFPTHRSKGLLFTAVRPEKVSSSSTRTCQLPASCFSCPRFSSTFCTLCLTQWAVPHIRYCSPFHFCTSEVDPGCAGTTLDHGATSIGLFAVTSDLIVIIGVFVRYDIIDRAL